MKIIFLHDSFPPQSFGGGGISVYGLAKSMSNLGHDIFVVTTCRIDSEAGEFTYENIKIFRIFSNYPEKWRAYKSLYNKNVVHEVESVFKKIKPDVVHINNVHYHLSYYCFKIAKQHAKIVVFTVRDVMAFNFEKLTTKRYLKNFDYHTTWLDHLKQAKKRWNPFRNFFIKLCLNYADKKIAISKALKEALKQNGIKETEVIYNGINYKEWDIDSETASRFRFKYDLGNKKIILFGGRLSPSKGAEKTIEAFVQITKKIPNTILLVIGKTDSYTKIMKEKADKFEVSKKIVFTDWIEKEEIKSAYFVADVVLMPSVCFDSFGRVNIEAMSCKKPVVGTCYGGTPEIVIDGVTGYIVNPLYPEEIAEKTIDLLKNSEKAKRFGEAGYDRVKKKFDLEKIVNEYIKIYEVLIKKK